MEGKRMTVDFSAKKTEAGWQETFDAFWKALTPIWFDWLEWVLILGVFTLIEQETGNVIVGVATAFSWVAVFFYLQSIFYSIEFVGFPGVRSIGMRRSLSVIISGALSLSTWLVLRTLVGKLGGYI